MCGTTQISVNNQYFQLMIQYFDHGRLSNKRSQILRLIFLTTRPKKIIQILSKMQSNRIAVLIFIEQYIDLDGGYGQTHHKQF